MTALHELLSERQRFEGWIQTLEDRKASTPPHVFQRVHNDYTDRLNGVLARLSERTGQIRVTIDTMSTQLAELRSKENERIDARDEAELRAAVGEYTEEEWTYLREEATREIDVIAAERASVELELGKLQKIVASSEGSSEGSPVVESAANVESVPVAEVSAIEFTSDSQNTEAEQFPLTSPAASPTSQRQVLNDVVADWPANRKTPSQPIPRSENVERTTQSDRSEAAPSLFAPPKMHADPANEPPRREAEKTLKCPECATLNYATEWYCERCGGELATY